MIGITTVGVVVADRAVHVTAHGRSGRSYTAEPLADGGADARREALATACRRLGVRRRARAALALPEARVYRRTLALPRHARRAERAALARLQIRQHLPPPSSAWGYRIVRLDRTRGRLLAARRAELAAARQLLREAGLRPAALLPSREALRDAPRPSSAEGAGAPAARLSAALADAARRRHPPGDLLRAVPAEPTRGPAPRTMVGAGIAAGLLAVAAYYRLAAGPAAEPPSRPGPTTESPEPPAAAEEEEQASPEPDPPRARPAERAARDEARRRRLPEWLDTLARHRPPSVHLREARFGEALAVTATAAQPAAARAYLEALDDAELPEARLEGLRRSDTGIAVELRAEPPLTDAPTASDEAPAPVDAQLAALAEGARDQRALRLQRLERRRGAEGGAAVAVELRAAGRYPALRAWLGALAAEPGPLGVRRARLVRDEPPLVRLELELRLPRPEAGRG